MSPFPCLLKLSTDWSDNVIRNAPKGSNQPILSVKEATPPNGANVLLILNGVVLKGKTTNLLWRQPRAATRGFTFFNDKLLLGHLSFIFTLLLYLNFLLLPVSWPLGEVQINTTCIRLLLS